MKTKIVVWGIVLFALFTLGFIWLMSHAYVVMTLGITFKIMGAFVIVAIVSYWIGYISSNNKHLNT